MDHHAVLVPHRGYAGAAAERYAGVHCAVGAINVTSPPEPLNGPARGVFVDADAGDREAVNIEGIAPASEDQGAVAPSEADADRCSAARQFDNASRGLCP